MAGAEQVFRPALVSAPGSRIVAAPFGFNATGEDNLRIVSVNSLGGVVLTIAGRRLNTDGKIEVFQLTHAPNSDRSVKTQDVPLGVGGITNLTIYASTGAPRIGQTFVMVKLIRGLGGATTVLGTLLAGYVTAVQALGFPGSPIQTSLDGGGYTREIHGTIPALGAEMLETVPTGARWELMSFSNQLAADATVANRQPILRFGSGAAQLSVSVNPGVCAASNTNFFYWAQGMPLSAVAITPAPLAGLPTSYPLLAGMKITTETVNLKAGDQWQTPVYIVREWLEVDQ